MGSWSVYCGISNITIQGGEECILLPLRKNKEWSEIQYVPATLPIFGNYNDGGGIENIVKDKNTERIEKYFSCTIEDFCYFLTRRIYIEDEPDFPKFPLKQAEELSNYCFMFIDKMVYDYLSTLITNESIYPIEYGSPRILKLLGATPFDDSDNFNYILNGVIFYSDGIRIKYNKQDVSNFYFDYKAIKKYFNLSDDLDWIEQKSKEQLWEYYYKWDLFEIFFTMMGWNRYNLITPNYIKNFTDIYAQNITTFAPELCQMLRLILNIKSFSHTLTPYIKYITPQFGDNKNHFKILKQFTKILKNKIKNE